METRYFKYGKKELDYLKSKDKKLSDVIDKIGYLKEPIFPDVFSSVIYFIVGQQISAKAHQTIWQRLKTNLGSINQNTILNVSDANLQKLGLSFRKVTYIKNFALKIHSNKLNLERLNSLTNEEVSIELSKLDGIGKWTAEMILIFSLERKDVFSYGDLAILRGLRMIYHHKKISQNLFNRYKKRFSPYASVASLYIWAVAEGALPEMKDYPQKKKD